MPPVRCFLSPHFPPHSPAGILCFWLLQSLVRAFSATGKRKFSHKGGDSWAIVLWINELMGYVLVAIVLWKLCHWWWNYTEVMGCEQGEEMWICTFLPIASSSSTSSCKYTKGDKPISHHPTLSSFRREFAGIHLVLQVRTLYLTRLSKKARFIGSCDCKVQRWTLFHSSPDPGDTRLLQGSFSLPPLLSISSLRVSFILRPFSTCWERCQYF